MVACFRISPSDGSFSVVLSSIHSWMLGVVVSPQCFGLSWSRWPLEMTAFRHGGSACCVASYGSGGREFAY